MLIALLVMPGVASAQRGLGAPDFRDRFTDVFDDTDFCGTGETVHVVERIVGNVWTTDDESLFKVVFSGRTSLTYEGTTIFAQNVGRVHDVRIEGSEEGAHTHHVVETGIRSKLRVPGQGVVTIDHGNLEYLVFIGDDGEFLGLEVLKDAGGHPDFYDPVWCEAAIELLGIPT
jgi:hypothetical protein